MSLNTVGAICRQASQSMHVESTKKSPSTFSEMRNAGRAMFVGRRLFAVGRCVNERPPATGYSSRSGLPAGSCASFRLAPRWARPKANRERIILPLKALNESNVRQPAGQTRADFQDAAR